MVFCKNKLLPRPSIIYCQQIAIFINIFDYSSVYPVFQILPKTFAVTKFTNSTYKTYMQ